MGGVHLLHTVTFLVLLLSVKEHRIGEGEVGAFVTCCNISCFGFYLSKSTGFT